MEGKVAVVTGGASGIGQSTVTKFVERGGRVIIADIQDDTGTALAKSLGEQARFVHCDVTREEDIVAAVAAADGNWGRLDLMFNNAGAGGDPASIDMMTADGWDRTMDLLLRSAMLGIRHASTIMKRQGYGSIVSTSSSAARMPGLASIGYSVAKMGVLYMTQCAALELAAHSIRVNCVCPGFIATPLIGRSLGLAVKDAEAAVDTVAELGVGYQPLPYGARADDIAEAVLYLAEDRSAFITGVALPVDGGLTLGRTVQQNAAAWGGIATALGGSNPLD
ncbi:MAG: SDR family oxidoreductase [Sphingobium sp.]